MTELEYAILWLDWKHRGFKGTECPWRNAREMRKHPPTKGRIIYQAEQILAAAYPPQG